VTFFRKAKSKEGETLDCRGLAVVFRMLHVCGASKGSEVRRWFPISTDVHAAFCVLWVCCFCPEVRASLKPPSTTFYIYYVLRWCPIDTSHYTGDRHLTMIRLAALGSPFTLQPTKGEPRAESPRESPFLRTSTQDKDKSQGRTTISTSLAYRYY
jgi:hypothetical protein